MMTLTCEHAYPCSVISQYDFNSQLHSSTYWSADIPIYAFELQNEWGFFGCIVFISTLTTQLFSLVPERLTASNPEQILSQSPVGIYIL